MKRYMMYSSHSRFKICLAVIFGTIAYMAAASTILNTPVTITSLFFAPSIIAPALMLSINFWYKSKSRRHWYYADNSWT